MSQRYFGGLIRKTPLELDPALGNAANGVFTMDQYMQAVKAGIWPASDPFFENTVLLLHGNGTNGAQNNTFLDSSTNNFTITRNGNTTQGTFSPFSKPDGRWGNFFAGTNGFLTTATNADFTFGTGDFTVEFWCYPISSTGLGGYAYLYAQGPNTTASLGIYFQSNTFRVWNGSAVITGTVSRATNTWYHVAVSRSGTSMKLFVNGVQDGSTATNSSNITTGSTYGATLGRWVEISDANYFVGYLASVRAVKGTALYTSNFTPSTAPLTAVSGTELLTCQSNRFIDNSSNAFAITRNGDVKVTPFSPFPITTAYSTSVNGGAGYFDGSGDYLTVASNAALNMEASDFTMEAWIYPTAGYGTNSTLFSKRSSNAVFGGVLVAFLSSNAPHLRATTNNSSWNMVNSQSSISIVPNQWNHVAVARSSGNWALWINGVRGVNVSGATGTVATNTDAFGIGACADGSEPFGQPTYLAGSRVVKGTAVYDPTSSTITVPTAPVTAITNTSLLCNFTNAGIFDNTGFNALETVGNAQIDTSVKKYGTGSMEFDGTTDYVVQPTSDNYGYGTGDFTIEFWLYLNSTGLQTVVSNLSGNTATQPHIYINTTIRYYTASADRITGASLSTGQWYHIAVCRASGSTRLFIDGTQSGSTYSDTNNYGATAPLGIGTYWNSGAPVTTNTLNGYIDDLRITKGIARYTINFVPQTSQWQDV